MHRPQPGPYSGRRVRTSRLGLSVFKNASRGGDAEVARSRDGLPSKYSNPNMTLPINTTICRIGIRYYAANPNAIAKTKQNPHSPKQRETRRRRNFACLFTFTSCPCKGVVDTCVGAVCRAARLYLPRKPYALCTWRRKTRTRGRVSVFGRVHHLGSVWESASA